MNHKICETVKNLRISRNISQENFANALGVSAQAVSKWENRKALPDISLLPKIADYFHVTIDTLFKGVIQDENQWLDNISDSLETNRIGWNGISSKNWGGTILPSWGVYMAELLKYGKQNSDMTILEGILDSEEYHSLFETAVKEYGENIFAYYYDLLFEETLRRHSTKPNRNDFGEADVRRWWREKDYLSIITETILTEDMSFDDAVNMIYQEVNK